MKVDIIKWINLQGNLLFSILFLELCATRVSDFNLQEVNNGYGTHFGFFTLLKQLPQ